MITIRPPHQLSVLELAQQICMLAEYLPASNGVPMRAQVFEPLENTLAEMQMRTSIMLDALARERKERTA